MDRRRSALRVAAVGALAIGSVGCSDPPSPESKPHSAASGATATSTGDGGTSEVGPAALPDGPVEVLVVHATAGEAHQSIPAGVTALNEIGEAEDFQVTSTDTASVFTLSGLAPFDVVVFLNTSGDVLDPNHEEAFEHWYRDGGGLVGIHSAADTERVADHQSQWFEILTGASARDETPPQDANVTVVAPDHPSMQGVPTSFSLNDGWYNFDEVVLSDITVLAEVDESSYSGGTMGEAHPIVWTQDIDGGRAFYSGLGHSADSFADPGVRTMLGNAVRWASAERN